MSLSRSQVSTGRGSGKRVMVGLGGFTPSHHASPGRRAATSGTAQSAPCRARLARILPVCARRTALCEASSATPKHDRLSGGRKRRRLPSV